MFSRPLRVVQDLVSDHSNGAIMEPNAAGAGMTTLTATVTRVTKGDHPASDKSNDTDDEMAKSSGLPRLWTAADEPESAGERCDNDNNHSNNNINRNNNGNKNNNTNDGTFCFISSVIARVRPTKGKGAPASQVMIQVSRVHRHLCSAQDSENLHHRNYSSGFGFSALSPLPPS